MIRDGGAASLQTRAQYGTMALFVAAQNGHADSMRLLLDAGADKDAKNKVSRVGQLLDSHFDVPSAIFVCLSVVDWIC